jgi:hypothetical protein
MLQFLLEEHQYIYLSGFPIQIQSIFLSHAISICNSCTHIIYRLFTQVFYGKQGVGCRVVGKDSLSHTLKGTSLSIVLSIVLMEKIKM